MKKFLIITSLVALAGCPVREKAVATPATNQTVIVPVAPGQKLIGVAWRSTDPNQPAKLWLETRVAEPNEQFGIIMHSEHDPATGDVVRRFVIMERPIAAAKSPFDSRNADVQPSKETEPEPAEVTTLPCEDFAKGPVQ